MRIGIHTGEAQLHDGRYVGMALHRAARVAAAAHGGQLLVSSATRALIAGLPDDVRFKDLGEHELKDLPHPERLFQVLAPGLAADFPPPRSLGLRRHNLPSRLTSFVGRGKEVARLRTLVTEQRLVTIVGAGGAGKTSLAIEVASELVAQFDGGVWFVELAPLTSGELIEMSLATAVGVAPQAGRATLDVVAEHIRDRPAVILLDNCEHLVSAAAAVVSALLQSCPQLTVLTTSREALAVDGELLHPVAPLSLPVGHGGGTPEAAIAESEAVRLFVERASTARPGFDLATCDLEAVTRICSRVDALPLAIELAAARVRALSVTQIAERLDERFDLLADTRRSGHAHHRTLRATIDWSYELLDEDERKVLRRLAVFAGSCGIEAAESVCGQDDLGAGAVLDVLTRLVDKSLVAAEPASAGMRYRLLESIREYALERFPTASERAASRDSHLRWFADLAGFAEEEILGPDDVAWFDLVALELDNVRAAAGWSSEGGDAEDGLRLLGRLWMFWYGRGQVAEGGG